MTLLLVLAPGLLAVLALTPYINSLWLHLSFFSWMRDTAAGAGSWAAGSLGPHSLYQFSLVTPVFL